ncbi:MAG: NAD(+)/NADH kinase [Acidobacteriota bacterium]
MGDKRVAQIGVISKPAEPRAIELLEKIIRWAADNRINLLINDHIVDALPNIEPASLEKIGAQSDLIVVLGGDGTMITAAAVVAGRGTPVLGVNLGTLGYLTEFTVEEAIPALEDVSRGDYLIDLRMMLDWRVAREGEEIGAASALNEVVVTKAAEAKIIDIRCSVDSHHVTDYRADGLMVSTPTGSTAYNLSAGGPIIVPGAEVMVICPLCPHTLTNRPLVLPDRARVSLRLNTREQEVILTSDGQVSLRLEAGDLVEISRSEKTFNIIRARERDYFEILRTKLKWSGK